MEVHDFDSRVSGLLRGGLTHIVLAASRGTTHEMMHRFVVESDAGGGDSDKICTHNLSKPVL